ncbi:MAG: DNA gyrase subunit A, partial [Actinomycetota bacterium]|nr:DNA gyrase subunit A [Actinomycetota bacterium]
MSEGGTGGLDALTGRIEDRELTTEMRSSYLDYAMSVIVGRALPDVRDGLKPVHRRVLYAMHDLGLQPNRGYRKCAFIVGEVMGKYHPHGDSAIYDTLVRLAQDFALRSPLVDGQGNFGSIDDDPAAAMRYCVTGDTRIATPNGTARIDAIVPGARPESDTDIDLEVLDRLGQRVRASKLFHSGAHPTLRMRATTGEELVGSFNHPVLCRVDMAGVPLLLWKLLQEIKPGDRVAMRAETGERLEGCAHIASTSLQTFECSAATALLERVAPAALAMSEAHDADYLYAEVESVAHAGVQAVYSLRVDSDDHSFLTNGFVSHNTEARLERLATEMLRDIDADTVDFGLNYDETSTEPLVLPARFPNLLVNGSTGIAVGMATNIPPHNLGEVIQATKAYIANPSIDLPGLMEYVKGPDFPGGGMMSAQGIRDAYASGRGSVRIRAVAHVEPLRGGKDAIIVSELPYMVKKGGEGGLITKIADLVRDKKITGISDLRDESDRSGMRLVIELKRGGDPAAVVLNQLYKHTPMQNSFGMNMVALVNGVPRTLGLKELIHHYVDHQRDVIVRRTQYELRQAEARAHVLEGLLIALDNLDAVITLIRASADPVEAKAGLIERFELTEIQAQAILDMRLQRLTALESDKVRAEHAELMDKIAELRAILGDPSRIDGIIVDELNGIEEKYADDRRTEITHFEGDLNIEDVIADQQMVVSLTNSGYAKRLPLATYRQQRRGGIGVMGMNLKEDDYIEHLHICSTHDFLLFFTNRGKVYRLKVYELPEGSRTHRGQALVNVLPLREGERVMAVIPTRDFREDKFLVFATAGGQIKKTEFLAYNTKIKADGIIAIKIRDDDELVQVRRTSGDDDIIMVSKSGNASRFNESAVRPMGRGTAGVRGMNVAGKAGGKPNRVLAMDVARDDAQVFVVTENGYGKRTPVPDYPVKGRGTKGVLTIKITEKKGALAGAMIVREHQDLLFISQNGMVQRTNAGGISQT